MNDMNIKPLHYQRGATFWNMAFILGVLGLVAYIAMQLVPVYSTNSNVKNAMILTLDDIDIDLRRVKRSQIQDRIDKQLYLDASHDVLNYKEDLKISRSDQKFILQTKYTRTVPLFFNLSLLAEFDNIVERDLK